VWVLLETDPAAARRAAREALSRYLPARELLNRLRARGLATTSPAALGALSRCQVAWGDERAIRARIQDNWDAGADHVCIQPISLQGSRQMVDERILDLLAPAHRS